MSTATLEKPKRRWVYVQQPHDYEMSPCSCGNTDTQWSEYQKHLWCAKCEKDFIPESAGIFDGPIGWGMAELMGISFARVNLETSQLEKPILGDDKIDYFICDKNQRRTRWKSKLG